MQYYQFETLDYGLRGTICFSHRVLDILDSALEVYFTSIY